MINMSYCRMENTNKALDECFNAIALEDYNEDNPISYREAGNLKRMIHKFYDFLEDYCLVDDEGVLIDDEVNNLINKLKGESDE